MDGPVTEHAPQSTPRRLSRWFITAIALVIVAAVFVSVVTRGGQHAAPRLAGSVWRAPVGESPRLYFVMEEERWERRIPNWAMRHHWFTVDFTVFSLQARDGHSGEPAGATELARIDFAPSGQGPEILGPQDNVLWLWNGGLEARALDTLATVLTPGRIAELNPEFAAVIPQDRKYCRVLGKLEALIFKGQDARYYRVDAASGKIQPLADADLARLYPSNRADDAFNYLYSDSDSLWSTSTAGLMWNALAVNDMWYALLTADERAGLTSRPGRGKAPDGESVRSLYRARFELEDRPALQSKEILLDLDTLEAVGDARFVMGGFLRRPTTGELWRVDGGKSCLVLHRNALGEDNPWLVTRQGLDGRQHWTRSTSLAQVQHLSETGGVVVFTGFADMSQPTNRRPDQIVFIDELSGQARRVNLVTQEITPLEN